MLTTAEKEKILDNVAVDFGWKLRAKQTSHKSVRTFYSFVGCKAVSLRRSCKVFLQIKATLLELGGKFEKTSETTLKMVFRQTHFSSIKNLAK